MMLAFAINCGGSIPKANEKIMKYKKFAIIYGCSTLNVKRKKHNYFKNESFLIKKTENDLIKNQK